jgi:cytochrome b subunit of formate dehydrogenase
VPGRGKRWRLVDSQDEGLRRGGRDAVGGGNREPANSACPRAGCAGQCPGAGQGNSGWQLADSVKVAEGVPAAAVTLKALLATAVLGVTGLQVLLALWIYRKLPLAGNPPRPVRLAHRVVGFALVALTVPIALHCLIAYGVQFTSLRVAVHSLAGCFSTVHSSRKSCWSRPGGCPDGCCQ